MEIIKYSDKFIIKGQQTIEYKVQLKLIGGKQKSNPAEWVFPIKQLSLVKEFLKTPSSLDNCVKTISTLKNEKKIITLQFNKLQKNMTMISKISTLTRKDLKSVVDYYEINNEESDFNASIARYANNQEEESDKLYLDFSDSEDSEDSEEEYEVERIENIRRTHQGSINFLVKWVGFDKPTWEHEDNLHGCKDLIEEFLQHENMEIVNEKEQYKISFDEEDEAQFTDDEF